MKAPRNRSVTPGIGQRPVGERNFAFFSTQQRSLFTEFFRSIAVLAPRGRVFVVAADDKAVAAAKGAALRQMKVRAEGRSFADLAFLQVPVSFREIAGRITDWMGAIQEDDGRILAVDMGWGLETNSAMANFEKWMMVAEDLADRTRVETY